MMCGLCEFSNRYRKAFVDYRVVLNLGSNSDIAQQGSDRYTTLSAVALSQIITNSSITVTVIFIL